MRHWTSEEAPVCNCRLVPGKKACGENCINRVLNIECKLRHCPCGASCSNRQFQLRKYAKIERFLTNNKVRVGSRPLQCGTAGESRVCVSSHP
jgi:histone-lysine N-methyltransferase SETD2